MQILSTVSSLVNKLSSSINGYLSPKTTKKNKRKTRTKSNRKIKKENKQLDIIKLDDIVREELVKNPYDNVKPLNSNTVTTLNPDNEEFANAELEFEDITNTDNSEYIPQLSKEMIESIEYKDNKHSMKMIDSRFINLALATDRNTAIQICALLGVIKYCMEKSGEGVAGDNKRYSFTINIQNRNNSPFMIGIGDDYISSIPVVDSIDIGN